MKMKMIFKFIFILTRLAAAWETMSREIRMKPSEAMGDAFPGSQIEHEKQIHFQCEPEPVAADDLLRCMCGALIARWVAAGLELKCRRCKRTKLIPYPQRTAVTRRHPT